MALNSRLQKKGKEGKGILGNIWGGEKCGSEGKVRPKKKGLLLSAFFVTVIRPFRNIIQKKKAGILGCWGGEEENSCDFGGKGGKKKNTRKNIISPRKTEEKGGEKYIKNSKKKVRREKDSFISGCISGQVPRERCPPNKRRRKNDEGSEDIGRGNFCNVVFLMERKKFTPMHSTKRKGGYIRGLVKEKESQHQFPYDVHRTKI